MKPSISGLLFVGIILSWFQFHCLGLVYLYFLFLPNSVFECSTFPRICPFLPDCPCYWHIVVLKSLYDPIYFCSVCCNFFLCIILLIWFSSLLFLMSLAIGLSILFIFLKNHLLVLLIFAMFASFLFHLFQL